MVDLISHLVDAPLANILIFAGLIFLAIAVIGKISGKIEPSNSGRVMSGAVGLVLLVYGIYTHGAADAASGGRRRPMENTARGPEKERPERPPNQPSSGPFSGMWKNDNPQTRGISRLEVRQNGALVFVHAWGACSPQDCDWGTERGAVSNGSASVAWDQSFVLRKMTLMADAGRLRVTIDSVYRDKRAPQHSQEYFIRTQ
jgi:hypothetical protein